MEEKKKKIISKKFFIYYFIILLVIVLTFLPFWINTYFSQVANYFAYKGNVIKAIKIIIYQTKIDKKLFGKTSKPAIDAQEKLADYYRSYGDVRSALPSYLDAYKIRQEKGYINDFGYSHTASGIATCYVDLYDFKKAESYYKESFMISKKQNDKEGMIANMINLANLYIQTNQINKATAQINQLNSILNEKNIKKQYLYLFIIYSKVKYYERIGNYQKAKNLVEDILYAKKLSSKANKTMFLGELAKIYQLERNFGESEKTLNELIILNKKSSNYEIAKILRKIALLNVAIKHNKKAEDYLKKSLELISKPAYRYSHEIVCDYNYLLMLSPQNSDYTSYFKSYINYINSLNFISAKEIKLYLNSACDY